MGTWFSLLLGKQGLPISAYLGGFPIFLVILASACPNSATSPVLTWQMFALSYVIGFLVPRMFIVLKKKFEIELPENVWWSGREEEYSPRIALVLSYIPGVNFAIVVGAIVGPILYGIFQVIKWIILAICAGFMAIINMEKNLLD
jgi:hypothetical protein